MKPSNTSRSESGFGGVLQPLVDLLRRTDRRSGHLAGQDVVLPRADIQAIVALDSAEDVHLLITPAAGDDERFSKLDLRGLRVADRDWSVSGRAPQRYLDISCSTGTSPTFLRPFLRFAEDVLYEVGAPGVNPVDALYRTGLRWRRFWSPEVEAQVTQEWVRGLCGELRFLEQIIKRFGPSACQSWSGPLGHDHDFQRGTDLAVEVKTSAEMPFTIQCNIRQLDPGIFRRLYLVCYRVSRSDDGVALPQLVSQVEEATGTNAEMLDFFYRSLAAVGYRRELENIYAENRFEISDGAVFSVDESFPTVTERSFSTPPDHRVSNIRYTLQITGVDSLGLDDVAHELGSLGAE